MYILWNIYNKFPQTVIQIIIFTIIIITLGRTGRLMEHPPGEFWRCNLLKWFFLQWKAFDLLYRGGIFYGWWRRCRSVTSPIMVAIDFIKNWNQVKTVHHFIHKLYHYSWKNWENMHFRSKMTWPPTTYYAVISRNHSNWPSLNLSENALEG